MSEAQPKILACRCIHRQDVIPLAIRELMDKCADSGNMLLVDDLCGMAARYDERLKNFVSQDSPVILACHLRAVRALFVAAGCPLPPTAEIINSRAAGIEDIAAKLDAYSDKCVDAEQVVYDENWVPWFPVIDPERCTNCKQCLNFCLFNTYALDDDEKVFVKEPSVCKTNCPACARICPSVAIIFPKYEESPINGGPIEDENIQSQRVKVDTQKILGSDVYGALRKRQQKRKLFSDSVRNEQIDKARLERDEWLKRQKEGGR